MEIIEEKIKFGNYEFNKKDIIELSKMCQFTANGVRLPTLDAKKIRNSEPIQKAIKGRLLIGTGVGQPLIATSEFGHALKLYKNQ